MIDIYRTEKKENKNRKTKALMISDKTGPFVIVFLSDQWEL